VGAFYQTQKHFLQTTSKVVDFHQKNILKKKPKLTKPVEIKKMKLTFGKSSNKQTELNIFITASTVSNLQFL
jgi:hypothetical protein